MLDADIRIMRQVEDARFDLDGTSTYFVRVEFMVGKHGPFVERVPKDGFTAATRDGVVNAFAREVRTP